MPFPLEKWICVFQLLWNTVTVHCWVFLWLLVWGFLTSFRGWSTSSSRACSHLSPHSQIAWECIPQCFFSCHNRVWIGRALSTTTFPTGPRQIGLRIWNNDWGIPVILVSLWWEWGANWWRHGFMSMSIILTRQGLLFIESWRHRQVKQYEVLQKLRDVLGKITSNIRQFRKISQMHDVGNNCWTRAWVLWDAVVEHICNVLRKNKETKTKILKKKSKLWKAKES